MVTFTNNALLSYTYPGNPDPTETQSNDVTTTLLDARSLTVQKTATPGTYRLGETVTCLVLLTNTGSQPLTTLILADTEIWGRILAKHRRRLAACFVCQQYLHQPRIEGQTMP